MIGPRRRMALSSKKWSSFWVWVNWGFGFSYSVAHILPAPCKMIEGGGGGGGGGPPKTSVHRERLYKLAVQLTTLLSSSVSWEGGREGALSAAVTRDWRQDRGQTSSVLSCPAASWLHTSVNLFPSEGPKLPAALPAHWSSQWKPWRHFRF